MPRGVGPADVGQQGGLEFGIRKRGFQLIDGVLNPWIEDQPADRPLARALEAGELDALRDALRVSTVQLLTSAQS